MNKEYMTSNQVIAIIIVFIFGSSVIFGINTNVGQDSWISLILAIIFSIPLIIMYARIIKLNPREGIYDIVEKLFGKIISKIIIVSMIWYSIHLASLVVRNFSEYIQISTLTKTPQIIVITMILLVVVYIAKSKIGILGKWSLIVYPALGIMVIITLVFSISNINLNNIFPIMEHSVDKIVWTGFNSFAFPFGETVVVLALAKFFKKKDSPYKIFISGILIGGLFLVIVLLRNLTILGVPMMMESYFSSFTATRVIEVGDFLTNIEGIITINFILAGITKITVCVISAAIGIAKLFRVKNYNNFIIPTSLFVLALCIIIYENVTEMFSFIDIYGIYAIPFQIIIPLLIWILSEKNAKKNKLIH